MSIAAPINIDEGMLSHRGRVRRLNEDSFGSFRSVLEQADAPKTEALLQRKGRLYVVADGMGGHDSGDLASATAVQQVCTAYYQISDPNVEAALRQALSLANTAIYARAQQRHGDTRPMGTTIVAAVIHDRQLSIAHVGDSRAYLLRNGVLQHLTNDHDWITEQIQRHGLSREQAEQEARKRGARGVLMRALGVQPEVQPDIITIEWRPGDKLLLSTDGLHGLISDAQISQIIDNQPVTLAARELINAANAAGGHDNITALVVGQTAQGSMAARLWRHRVLQAGVILAAVLLIALSLQLPIVNGSPLVKTNQLLGLELPTLAATSALLATPTDTPIPPTSTPEPTATWTPIPTATALPPARIPVAPKPPTRRPATVQPIRPSPKPASLTPGRTEAAPSPTQIEPTTAMPTQPPAIPTELATSSVAPPTLQPPEPEPASPTQEAPVPSVEPAPQPTSEPATSEPATSEPAPQPSAEPATSEPAPQPTVELIVTVVP